MGRTVPAFRLAEIEEASRWKEYRKALAEKDREAFDEMLATARLYVSASSAAVRPSRFEGVAMAIVFHHQRLLMRCVGALDQAAQGMAPSFSPPGTSEEGCRTPPRS